MIAMRGNRITTAPLMKCVEQTRAIAAAIDEHDYERALDLRGDSFKETLARCAPCCAHCRIRLRRARSSCAWPS